MQAEALQLSLYERHVPATRLGDGDSDGLRVYQREAVNRIHEELAVNRSTLLVMATGLGKTQTFGAVAKHWNGRVLVLAHRDELIQQAARRLEMMTGELTDLEQAQWRASGSRIVVGSVQTLSREGRLKRFPKDAFSLIIVDEAHHAVAASYRRILDHFDAKVLGVTATPDRQDERAMGQVFETVAYVREISDGIKDGYLCPIRMNQVDIESIDLSAVHTLAGDLNQGELNAVMGVEEALHGVAKPTVEIAGDRQTILFTTSVENAHRLAEIINRYKPDSARAVDGGTDLDQRRLLLRGHQQGEYQFLCNVGVLTEGYDSPNVSCIAMARPTKSRALYTQCVGRGLRPHVGKSDCLVLDFAGNAGKHRLVSAVDILGGKYDDKVVERAKKIAEKTPGMLAEEALEKAQQEENKARERAAAKRARVQGSVQYQTKVVDPFALFHVSDPGDMAARFGGRIASDKQLESLRRRGIDVPANCTMQQASKLIATAIKRSDLGLATYKQLQILAKHGITDINISFTTASRGIDAIARNGWRTPVNLSSIISAGRVPGEEG